MSTAGWPAPRLPKTSGTSRPWQAPSLPDVYKRQGERLAEAWVRGPAGDLRAGAQVVQGPQHVVVPAMGVPEQQVCRVRRLTGRLAAEQVSLQEELLLSLIHI